MAALRLVPVPVKEDGLDARSDDELMLLAQGGSTAAFSALVSRHGARLSNVCTRFLGDPDLGAELAQEAWVTAWERRGQYSSSTPPEQGRTELLVWLITIARNRCRNHLRGKNVRERYREQASQLTPNADAEQIEQLLNLERQARVRSALARLPEAMREALLLRYGEELRYDEIARVLGDNESTLRSRVHHGLKSLKNELEKKR